MVPTRTIALVGLSGTGKSSVARLLADRLGWARYDTDALIVEETALSVAAVFAAEGELAFRRREQFALARAAHGSERVVATGGGIVMLPKNRALLAQLLTYWLDAPDDIIMRRLAQHDEDRPLLCGDDVLGRIAELRRQRQSLYAEVSRLRIETDGRSLAEICDWICAHAGL